MRKGAVIFILYYYIILIYYIIYIDGYELYYINRSNKKPGGVALFVNCDLKCKQLKDMYMVIDDLMETVTVELEMERRSNIIVRCVYIENLEH